MKTSETSASRKFLHKKAVSAVYETEAFTSLLKNGLHPGGVDLTRRIVEIARAEPGFTVLDIGCGIGVGCRLFFKTYGCSVVGIDLSEEKIVSARGHAKEERLDGKAAFMVSDAERLPFRDACFDIVVSECVFSILPDKIQAAGEIGRVLRPKGRMVITDVVYREEMAGQGEGNCPLDAAAPLIPCLSAAGSIEEYTGIFEGAGLHRTVLEDHTATFRSVAYQMALRHGDWGGFLCRLSAQLSSRISASEGVEVDACSLDRYRSILSRARLGYALIGMTKP